MWFKVTPYLFFVLVFVALWGFNILDVTSGVSVVALFLIYQIFRIWTRPELKS